MNIIRTKVKNKFLFVEFEADLVRHMDKFIVHGKYFRLGNVDIVFMKMNSIR